jgi:hypothetical protein
VVLDTPRGDLVELSSSSYGLSLFYSKDGSHHDEGAGAPPGGSSSISIGDLWPSIDRLDEAGPEGPSAILGQNPRGDQGSHSCTELQGSKRMGEGSSCASRVASVGEVLGPSYALPTGYGTGSVKNKAVWILADAPGVILSRMRQSFTDRQYSLSTSMDQSKWEIILEELTRMELIVKKEPVSDGNE